MATIKARIEKLERVSTDNEPVKPGLILFVDGKEPTAEQKLQVNEAKANGQEVIIFTVVNASKRG